MNVNIKRMVLSIVAIFMEGSMVYSLCELLNEGGVTICFGIAVLIVMNLLLASAFCVGWAIIKSIKFWWKWVTTTKTDKTEKR